MSENVPDEPRPKELKNAPIVEAQVRFWTDEPVTFDSLAPLHDLVNREYPEAKAIVEHTGTVNMGDSPGFSQTSAPRGWAYWSGDQKRVVQAFVDGLAVSHLAPYGNWEALETTFRDAWKAYIEVVGRRGVAKVGVRYINRMLLPVEGIGGEFLRALPPVPPGMPQSLAAAFSRVVIPYPDSIAAAIVHAIDSDAGAVEDRVPVILDIDAFCVRHVASSNEDVWSTLRRLREIKNDAFYGCLSPAALRLFQ